MHRRGVGDTDDCRAPIPAFWIADDTGDKQSIKVMGFASNFAQVFDAIRAAQAGKKEPVADEFWAVKLPLPLPNVGAVVRVTGDYGVSFTKATGGVETDPQCGILTYEKVEYLEPPPTPALLPGMKAR